MKSLYQISQEVINLASLLEEVEFTPELEKQLEISQSELQEKAINYGHVIKEIKADVSNIDAEIKRLNDLKQAKNNTITRLEESLSNAMQLFKVDKVEIPTMKIYFRKSDPLEIEDESLIPENFMVRKETVNPNKVLIKKMIKLGNVVPGCKIGEKLNLQIK